jgi:glycosyltransferase involved in cell wall biosynthesis
MKIIQVCDYVPPAKDAMGAERIVERIAKGLVQLGHEVALKVDPKAYLCPVDGATLTQNVKGADVLHFHGWDPDHYDSFGIPWVATIHGYQLHQAQKQAYRMKNVVAVSQFAARSIGATQYVWNCADPEEFQYEPKKDEYFVWLAGTDWGEAKGLFTTIDLAKKLKIPLKIAGSGSNRDHIERIQEACDDKIEYLGSVNGAEKVNLIQKAKALFLFTRVPDACPCVVSEAMMCGTPVIGSKNGAMTEIVTHNMTGFTCTSFAEFVRAVRTIDRIAPKVCREYAEKFYSINESARRYTRIYEKIIDHYRNTKETTNATHS